MLIRDISNDPNQQIIQDYMSVLTGGRTVSVTLLYLLFAWRQKNITDPIEIAGYYYFNYLM